MAREGYIKIHRKMENWGWYSDPITKIVFLDILITAAHKEADFLGIKVSPGQAIIGRKKMANKLGITERQVRTALEHLKNTNEITTKTTNKYTVVTVENWAKYQCQDNDNDQQTTNKRPTNDQQTTTIKNVKNVKNVKNIYSAVPSELEEAFMDWIAMREKIKKPVCSKQTVTRTLNKLNKLANSTSEKIAILNQSTDNCWQDLYELKEKPVEDKKYDW